MEAIQFRETLDITMAPSMKFEYYKDLRNKYNKLIFRSMPKKPELAPDIRLDAAGVEAKEAMMGVFRSLKKGMGYG